MPGACAGAAGSNATSMVAGLAESSAILVMASPLRGYMTMSKDYLDFIEKLDRFRPRFGEQYLLPFDYEPDKDETAN